MVLILASSSLLHPAKTFPQALQDNFENEIYAISCEVNQTLCKYVK